MTIKSMYESLLGTNLDEIVQRADTTSVVALILALLLAIAVIVKYSKFGRKYPPGPVGLPIVGYLPFLTRSPHKKFNELAKKYGNVFSLYLGSCYIVVLNNYEAVKEAFSKDELLARPPDNIFRLLLKSPSMGDTHGQVWRDQRRFALHSLRDLGFGRPRMENLIKEEISQLLQEISKQAQPCDIHSLLTPSMSNNICSLVFGRRFDYNDPKRKELDDILNRQTKHIGITAVQQFFPWLFKLVGFIKIGSTKELYKAFADNVDFIKREIAEHRKTIQPSDTRDYIDAFLKEMDNKEHPAESHFTESMLTNNVMGFFGAGSGTVRVAIEWNLIAMAVYPEVQKKVHREIDDVIGPNKTPSWSDQAKMPYTNATLMEGHRWKTLTPVNIPRMTLADIKIQGYDIPAGTQVIANLWNCHTDPEHWKDPDTFKPERFINEDGKLVQDEHYIPFSIGKRSCPGESLAKSEVFLYFVSIMQRFKVELADEKDVDIVNRESLGIALEPKQPFRLSFKPRHVD